MTNTPSPLEVFLYQIYSHEKCKETLFELMQMDLPTLIKLNNHLQFQTAIKVIDSNHQAWAAKEAQSKN